MTYNVQVGTGGYLGWKLLERTSETQRAVFENTQQIQKSRDYFAEKLPAVKTADELVSDYKLISVALRAFGLDADIGNKAFIKKILEADPNDDSSIVNKLTDKRYLNLNKALALNTVKVDDGGMTVDQITDLYVSRSFEKNIGERYPEIEIALNAKRELPALAASSSSDTTKWYQIISSKSLRATFEGAFGLSSTFSTMPVERQATELKARFERLTGSSISEVSDTGIEKLIKSYLIRSQFSASTTTPYSAALTILRGVG